MTILYQNPATGNKYNKLMKHLRAIVSTSQAQNSSSLSFEIFLRVLSDPELSSINYPTEDELFEYYDKILKCYQAVMNGPSPEQCLCNELLDFQNANILATKMGKPIKLKYYIVQEGELSKKVNYDDQLTLIKRYISMCRKGIPFRNSS